MSKIREPRTTEPQTNDKSLVLGCTCSRSALYTGSHADSKPPWCIKPQKAAYAILLQNKRLRGVLAQNMFLSLCQAKLAYANLPTMDFLEQPTRTAYATPPELPTHSHCGIKRVAPEYKANTKKTLLKVSAMKPPSHAQLKVRTFDVFGP